MSKIAIMPGSQNDYVRYPRPEFPESHISDLSRKVRYKCDQLRCDVLFRMLNYINQESNRNRINLIIMIETRATRNMLSLIFKRCFIKQIDAYHFTILVSAVLAFQLLQASNII